MGDGGPHRGEHCRIEGRAIRDHLLGRDSDLLEPCEEAFDDGGINAAMDQLVANQPIAVRCSGIDRQQQRQVSLVHPVDTHRIPEKSRVTQGW